MSMEVLFVMVFMLVVFSLFVAMSIRLWLQNFILRLIAYSLFLSLSFLSIEIGWEMLSEGVYLASAVSDIVTRLRENDEGQTLSITIAVMASFIAALRKIGD